MHLSVESSQWRAGLLLRLGVLVTTHGESHVILSECPQALSWIIFSSCSLGESQSRPPKIGSCGRVSRVASSWTFPLYPSVDAVMNSCHGKTALLPAKVREGTGSSGGVWPQPLSDLHTNPPQTQPTPCLSTKFTGYISISSSEFATSFWFSLWDFLHWTLSYPRSKGSKYLILILETFDFWLSLKVD